MHFSGIEEMGNGRAWFAALNLNRKYLVLKRNVVRLNSVMHDENHDIFLFLNFCPAFEPTTYVKKIPAVLEERILQKQSNNYKNR